MCHVARTEGTACCPQRIPWQATEIPRYGCPGTRHGMTQGGGSLLRLFRAPQIARAWHALHPKSLHAPYVQKQPAASQYASTRHGMTQGAGQPAAALPRAPNRTCMACLAPQIPPCALRTEAACCVSICQQPAWNDAGSEATCCGSSARPKSHVHGMPCTPNPSMRPTYRSSLLRLTMPAPGME
jgi:hypothetical protein